MKKMLWEETATAPSVKFFRALYRRRLEVTWPNTLIVQGRKGMSGQRDGLYHVTWLVLG